MMVGWEFDWLTGSSLLLLGAGLCWRRRARLSPAQSTDTLEALADAVVRTAETNFRAAGSFKKRLALLTLRSLLQDHPLAPIPDTELEQALELAVRRLREKGSHAL